MAYSVILTSRAVADAEEAVRYIRRHAPEAASRWFEGLRLAVLSLAEMPERCARAPEAEILGQDMRQLLYGKRSGVYRIVFRIETPEESQPIVRVLAIRHGARDTLESEDLD